tara:strand:+ start:589 stop:960 length:372 start_codon:yes stop_codon:yes gene_type:complete
MFNQKNKALTHLSINRRYFLEDIDNPWKFRNKLTEIPNLGMAKASFAVELTHPTLLRSPVCLDTHVLGWLGHKDKNGKLNVLDYQQLETDFQTISKHPFITRNILWDKAQRQPNPRYWSYTLE